MKPHRGFGEKKNGSANAPVFNLNREHEQKNTGLRRRVTRDILETRLNLGISQEELSRMSGIPAGLIADIECGRGLPHDKALRRLADTLGVPFEIHPGKE